MSSQDVHVDFQYEDSRPVRLLLALTAGLVATIVTLTFTQVVLRFGFNSPQTWAEEVARYLFVWVTMLGAAIAFSRDSHIRLDAIVKLLPAAAEKPLDLLRRVLEAVAVGFLLYSGAIVAWQNRSSVFYTLPAVPQLIFYAAVPVGAALMLIYILRGILRRVRS
jgi:TRAP-type C4-dicarboxylate transport system permease small subunit